VGEAYQAVMRELDESVFAWFTNPRLYREYGVTRPPRVLLHGPSGVGKTHILRALAQEHYPAVRVLFAPMTEVFGPYVGDSERKLRRWFAQAARSSPCVLVLEGLETIAFKRERDADTDEYAGERRLLTTLLLALDGIDTDTDQTKDGSHSTAYGVVGTSQVPPSMLEESVVRAGRLERWIGMDGMPSEATQREMVAHWVGEMGSGVGVESVMSRVRAREGERVMPTDLRKMCRDMPSVA